MFPLFRITHIVIFIGYYRSSHHKKIQTGYGDWVLGTRFASLTLAQDSDVMYYYCIILCTFETNGK